MDKSMTRFRVADNSGAKEVGLIKVLRNPNRRPRIGSVVVVSVKKTNVHSKVKRGDIFKALVVRTLIPFSRKDGSFISFTQNTVVLLDENRNPFGTRIFGPMPLEIKSMGFTSVSSLAEVLV